jgi:hypothetical protein
MYYCDRGQSSTLSDGISKLPPHLVFVVDKPEKSIDKKN